MPRARVRPSLYMEKFDDKKDDHKKLENANAENSMREKNEGMYRGGRKEETCGGGFSRRLLRVTTLTGWAGEYK